MKRILTIAIAALLVAGCSGERDLSTPEGTFRTLRTAVTNKDIELYKVCFTDGALAGGEAEMDKFERDPDAFWAEFQGFFRGPQSIEVEIFADDGARGLVTAPQAEDGGIGGIRFARVGNDWKIRTW